MLGHQTSSDKEKCNGLPLVTTASDMDGRFYQTVTAVPAIVLEETPKSAEVKRSKCDILFYSFWSGLTRQM